MTDFELIQPIGWLPIGELLRITIIELNGNQVEWCFEDVSSNCSHKICISDILIEKSEQHPHGRKYFSFPPQRPGSRMFYLDEFTYHIK